MPNVRKLQVEDLESREVPATAFALGTGGIGANTPVPVRHCYVCRSEHWHSG